MNLKPYPEYRKSGFDWLGDLPTGWEAKRLKFGFDLQKRPISSDMEIVTAFRDGEVTLRKNRRLEGYTEGDKQIGYQGIEPGDLVIHAMDAFAGAIGVSDSRGKSTPVYNVCKPKSGVQARFFALALRHLSLTGYIESLSKGIRERSTDFRWADAKNVIVPFPPQNEQQVIVAYLDRETAEIDAFIADQEQLIALLKERRTATITQAVTKGLNPDAPMKNSGLEWLGEIPEHWTVGPLKRHLVRIEQGVSPEAASELADSSSTGVLKAGCVNGGIFQEIQHKRLPEEFQYDPKILVSEGDLLVNRASGSVHLVGSAAIVKSLSYRLILSDKIFRLRAVPSSSSLFLEKFLNSSAYRFQVRNAISGAEGLANNMPSSALKNFIVASPDLDEQIRIASAVDKETAKIDAAITDAREAIVLSKERRAAMISAAVTGKIDVRGLVGPAASDVEGVSVGVA